jgi:hypothetical protein
VNRTFPIVRNVGPIVRRGRSSLWPEPTLHGLVFDFPPRPTSAAHAAGTHRGAQAHGGAGAAAARGRRDGQCSQAFYEAVQVLPNVKWGKLPRRFTAFGKGEAASKQRYVHAKVYRVFSPSERTELMRCSCEPSESRR